MARKKTPPEYGESDYDTGQLDVSKDHTMDIEAHEIRLREIPHFERTRMKIRSDLQGP